MSKIDVSFLNELDGVDADEKTGKSCLIQKIIERFPEDHQEKVADILENKNGYTTIAALKILRKTGIKEGSEDSVKKHRRQACICYI